MLTHDQVWSAIDALAQRHGMSASGLSRRAGLDPTTFNKSKRITPDGRPRWPSTESIAKILLATGESLDAFVGLVGADKPAPARKMPLIGSAEAALAGRFSPDGAPLGAVWDEIALAGIDDPTSFALEIEDAALTTLYRAGDILVLLPAAPMRRGDRLFVKLRSGEAMIGELRRETAGGIDLTRCGPESTQRAVSLAEVAFSARILWASQ